MPLVLAPLPTVLDSSNFEHWADAVGFDHYVVWPAHDGEVPVKVRILIRDLATASRGNLTVNGSPTGHHLYDPAKIRAVLLRFESLIRTRAQERYIRGAIVSLFLDDLQE